MFQTSKNYNSVADAYCIAIVDVNLDGKPDIVSSSTSAQALSVLLGNGNGTFKPAGNYSVGQNPNGLVTADLNGDAKPDVIVAQATNPGSVSVLINIAATPFNYSSEGPCSFDCAFWQDFSGVGVTGANSINDTRWTICVH